MLLNITDLLSLIIPLIAGILLGYVLQGKWRVNLGRFTFGVIMVLIFSLGFSIGSNSDLLSAMPRIGFNAIVILFLTLMFSVFLVKIGMKMVKMK